MQLPLIQQLTTQAVDNAKERELLDKAIIGMAAMVDLVERHRATQPNQLRDQPEAIAAESLDLIQLQASAAEQERRRIVAYIRDDADSVSFTYSQREALLEMASAIEKGLGSRS